MLIRNEGVFLKEYSIYQRHGTGTPFMIHFFNNIMDAKLKLYDIIRIEEESNRPYYIDNDFFDNKYNFISDLYYLKILVRDVTDWEKYSEEESKESKKNHNKIIFMQDYKKVLTK